MKNYYTIEEQQNYNQLSCSTYNRIVLKKYWEFRCGCPDSKFWTTWSM